MGQDIWTAVDSYIAETLAVSDPVLDAVLAANAEAGLPAIDVSPTQGRFLNLLARLMGATRILEIGTLGGYSTICLARALPEGGRLVTLEAEPHHADVARRNLASAGVSAQVDLRVGLARDTLPGIAAELQAPFDFVFIDADKPSNPDYFAWAMRLARPGGVIVVDNVIRGGAIVDAGSDDPRVQGVRRFFDAVAAEPRVSATALQTVGGKGYDGFALLRIT